MGSVINNLYKTLREYGYQIDVVVDDDPISIANISGDKLGNTPALFRVSDKICNIGIVIATLPSSASPNRETIALDALELNSIHPLARISAVKVSSQEGSEQYYALLLAETSFFHTELTKTKFDARAEAVEKIGFSMSKILSSKNLLFPFNPWFNRLQEA